MLKLNIQYILIIIISIILTGCKSDKCRNSGSPEGKYIANTYEETSLYLLIKHDGTFVHHYKDRNGKITKNIGKWKLSKTDCIINLDTWYCLGTQRSQKRPALMSATFEDGEIMPYIDVPIYKKEK